MVIVGVGTDLVAVTRFGRLIEHGGRRFLDRWFRPEEVDFCLARSEPARHAAARFAAKEAALKSLRTPGVGPLRWRDIEVSRDLDGLPGLCLHGSMRGLAHSTGVTVFHLSISHDANYATATVVAVSDRPHDSV